MGSGYIPFIIFGLIYIVYEELRNHTYSNLFRENLYKIKDYKQAIQEAPFLFTKPDYMLPKRKQSFIISFLTTTPSYVFIIYTLIFIFTMAYMNTGIIFQRDNFLVAVKDFLLAFGFIFLFVIL